MGGGHYFFSAKSKTEIEIETIMKANREYEEWVEICKFWSETKKILVLIQCNDCKVFAAEVKFNKQGH